MTSKITPKSSVVTTPAGAPSSTTTELITLSHHLSIQGTDYPPGSQVRVGADYARRLRRQGYVARS
ncbi:hypothetical protein ACIQCR_17120 [Streptomyces sp. NPDC093249]|uniref:hypothetical protein n=1 Tax=unclassified Streptomyces TaxID=2593676 RepID=UPI00344DC763